MPGNPYDFEYSVNDIETANDYAHKASSNGKHKSLKLYYFANFDLDYEVSYRLAQN